MHYRWNCFWMPAACHRYMGGWNYWVYWNFWVTAIYLYRTLEHIYRFIYIYTCIADYTLVSLIYT